ncbi:hypothetical protein L6452_38078 [Arctium lappa]|uniref:Uncharacterized protein n=1 Tax=Arctium lappa TaxID=4217 RepID=A0ACB8Y4T2_ARCLA|nr:hypothetical protein L6452_38078 [Arctium lappa]
MHAERINSSCLPSQAINNKPQIIIFYIYIYHFFHIHLPLYLLCKTLIPSSISLKLEGNKTLDHQSMYPKVSVEKQVLQDRGADTFPPFESLGLRYLVPFGAEIVPIDEYNEKVRRICVSAMPATFMAKGSGQIKNRQIKDVDRVIQRPRAVLSSPDNDYLIGKLNKMAFKRNSTPKAHDLGRVNSDRGEIEIARIRVRGTSPTSDTRNRPKIKDYTRSSGLNDKTCFTKLKP